jgi:multidrug efflux pump subunit AcrB
MIRWFAAHPTAANLLLVVLLALGLFSAPALVRETFPDYRPVEAEITVEYRGATAADVEDAICRRLFEALKGIDFLDTFECAAQDHLASAVATMAAGGQAQRFLADLRTEVDAITELPAQAETPVIRELHRSDLVAAVAVSGDLSPLHLESYARALETRLLAVQGVARVHTQGRSQRQWQIEASRDALRQYGLSVQDLARLVGRQNVDVPLGTLETADRDVLLRFVDQRRTAASLAELVILARPGGAELKLGDIARIREHYERDDEYILFDGERALVLEVFKSRHADALAVMDGLRALVAAEQSRTGPGVRLAITQDMTSIVRDRLQMLVANGIVGLLLVAAVMSLFFRPRLALWAVFGLPVAFAGAFAAMALFGLSLNMITLVALLMAIGIVMDDAVVITDNIAAQAARQRSPLEAVAHGTREVLPGVLSSFLTTVAVFAPLSFLAGELGAVLEVLPVVLIAALAASLVEAFWILPHHLRGSLRTLGEAPDSALRRRFDAAFARFRERVGRVADAAVRVRHAVLALLILMLLGSVGFIAGGNVRMEAMPAIDGDVLEARILMPQGTPLARTEAVVEQVVAALRELDAALTPAQPDGAALVRAVQVRFGHNAGAFERGAHVATVIVDLLEAERRSVDLAELTARWQAAIGPVAGVLSLNIQEPGFGPAGTPIEIRLQHDDLDRLAHAGAELAAELARYDGVYNVLGDLRPGKPQYRLALADGARALGFTADQVAGQLRAGVLGERLETLQIGAQPVEIVVRQSAGERATLDLLDDAIVMSADGRAVPLATVATIEPAREWARIRHIDGRRTLTVTAEVDTRVTNAAAIVQDLQRQWAPALVERFPELELRYAGQVARSAETGQSIARALAIGLLGIFVILSFQFRSYVEPLIVMLAIPMAFLGAIWGHVLMGYDLSMPSLIGAASLAGIVVNNSILLVQFIDAYRREGLDAAAAAGRASRARLRAIFISSSTTIAGLLPLLTETSTQATAVIPLVVSVVFGLLAVTVLVLLALPALYVILDDLGWTRSHGAADDASDAAPPPDQTNSATDARDADTGLARVVSAGTAPGHVPDVAAVPGGAQAVLARSDGPAAH